MTTLATYLNFSNGKKRPSHIGAIPVYGGNGILDYTDRSNNENCLVIGRVGAYCGSVYYASDACWVSDNAIAAKPIGKNSLRFFYYLLQSLHLQKRQIGTSQPLLTQGVLNAITCDAPGPIIQNKIAAVLSILDSKITLNNRLNDYLSYNSDDDVYNGCNQHYCCHDRYPFRAFQHRFINSCRITP